MTARPISNEEKRGLSKRGKGVVIQSAKNKTSTINRVILHKKLPTWKWEDSFLFMLLLYSMMVVMRERWLNA